MESESGLPWWLRWETVCSTGDPGPIPGLRRSPGEENGYPLQYSFLENSVDRRAWGTNCPWDPSSGGKEHQIWVEFLQELEAVPSRGSLHDSRFQLIIRKYLLTYPSFPKEFQLFINEMCLYESESPTHQGWQIKAKWSLSEEVICELISCSTSLKFLSNLKCSICSRLLIHNLIKLWQKNGKAAVLTSSVLEEPMRPPL